ncbi:MAG: DUF559 domain-containing protein [Deltaproteobacteria bacterium]|nr:DUF559 domain-containing protein [Deltaproteobacteria bacterium]
MRKTGTLHKALFWNQIKSWKLNGLGFDRQKIICNYVVDFYCAVKNVITEIDGSSHHGKEDYDKKRSGVQMIAAYYPLSVFRRCINSIFIKYA